MKVEGWKIEGWKVEGWKVGRFETLTWREMASCAALAQGHWPNPTGPLKSSAVNGVRLPSRPNIKQKL